MEINYSLEVRQAIKNYEPVVALESTIISANLPRAHEIKQTLL